MILGKDHLDEGRSAGRGLALFDLGQVSFVEFGMGGDKDAADAHLETEVAFRGLAQNIAWSLSGHGDCFHNLRRSGDFCRGCGPTYSAFIMACGEKRARVKRSFARSSPHS